MRESDSGASGGQSDDLHLALTEARAEAASLSRRLKAAERQVAVGRALASARLAAAEEDDTLLGAALQDLWSLASELEEANAALADEVADRRAELLAIDTALRESEERVRLAHRYAGAGAWDWDLSTGAVTWSEEYRDLLGLGRSIKPSFEAWLASVLPDDRAEVERVLQQSLKEGGPEFEVEYRAHNSRGDILWLSARGRLHRGEDGAAKRVTGLCIDITARKRAELALRDANANLQREVEREMAAREAAQARLTQTLKLEALGQLTGGVAHDFNNLLAVVMAGISLLARADDPARREKLLASIAQAAQRGADLTRRLLTFARRQALRPEPVALGPWLAEIDALLSRSLRADITVEIDAPEGTWPVMADPSEMELAVTNLALNAQDAMPRGGRLRIAVQNVTLAGTEEADELSGDFLRLDVEDNGTGMAPEALARAFEPFFTTKGGGGNGLGLAQVYGFARQSGGVARVSSKPGQGTCVTLLLPRAHEEASKEAAPNTAAARSLRVLVVEDDDAVASLVLDMMRHLEHAAVRASSPADALEMLERGLEADLVFTDVLMPGGMDGLDLARSVAARRPGLPVLLTSGYGGAPARVAEAGLPLLRKPYGLEALREALANAAGRQQRKSVPT
ncbi:PAS domain-containing hybrid sensor histidine kinase/response regulator [Roseomonas xinghualingensis]|uniref:PAS domain-containing hybrid sensor histidine kinase/response regulator n=1 Tax=Roseomonas xinghualingensis TaxID=2986475 RepID=UPI0021F10BF6|nr:hybrid sensor histidine kinase/response regulator [Roseomonas sp. SXEYE001]MCV4206846.1 ATP-binding protein [Roseomonas sp. SXEYE001]